MDEWLLIGERDGIGADLKVERELFGVTMKDRERHLYCIGKTGTGKTSLLQSMIVQDIEAGRGVAFLDPHGDSASELLNRIPPHRVNDVIYFSPADLDYPIGINFLAKVPPDQRFLIVEHLLSVFSHIWGLNEEYSPRLLNLLRNVITALLEKQGTTLLGIYRMLIDERYRNSIVPAIDDVHTRLFWEGEFGEYDKRKREDISESTLNKIGILLSSPIIRNCIGQVQNRIDFKTIADEKKILICNLSKGEIGEQGSKLIGAMISIQLYLATMGRASIPEEERTPFYLYIDEFQNFGSAVFENILSESRKYNLNVTLAHQYTSQLDKRIRDAVFGNVGSIISFQSSSADGELLAKEFSREARPVQPHSFSDLQPFEVHSRILSNGLIKSSFIGTTLPPESFRRRYPYRQSIINHTRSRYAKPRGEVETSINRWLYG
jgi:hypothetical protein